MVNMWPNVKAFLNKTNVLQMGLNLIQNNFRRLLFLKYVFNLALRVILMLLLSSIFSDLLPTATLRAKLEGDCDRSVGVVQIKMVLYIKTWMRVKIC